MKKNLYKKRKTWYNIPVNVMSSPTDFMIYGIIDTIKEMATVVFKVVMVIGIMLAPFYLVHLIETSF